MKNNTQLIYEYFDELLPNVGCELIYSKQYELLIAVMLSAQTTDKAVNKVTAELFSKYPSLESLNEASIEDIERIIMPIGLYKNKAKNLKLLCSALINNYHGQVPSSRAELTKLPGVGNKTAGVVTIELFKDPAFPVDTHVARVSKRLGLVKKDDSPDEIEIKLKKAFPRDRWIKLHHQFIHFGRYHCLASSPHCEYCKLIEICKEKHAK